MGNLFLDGMLGLAVGDALGVPHEFKPRAELQAAPVTDMDGYGRYRQPKGTWSDDTSMALCCADSLCRGFDPDDMMKKFSAWLNRRQYTAGGVVFDVGRICRLAIGKYDLGLEAELCGRRDENGNGNGGLMRSYPVSLWRVLTAEAGLPDAQLLAPVHAASALTHAHACSLVCCGIYTLFIDEWLKRAQGDLPLDAARRAWKRAKAAYRDLGGDFAEEMEKPGKFNMPDVLAGLIQDEISSGGYVLDTLNAAFWCLFTTDDFASCVLRAVNLGGDTDTTAAVAGSLAGLVYGAESIPQRWLDVLCNRSLIEDISSKLNRSVCGAAENEEICAFEGPHAHLALKYGADVEVDGLHYKNAYAAWLAQGVQETYRDQFAWLNAHQARRLFKQLPQRPDWQDVQAQELFRVCQEKYKQNPALAEKLLATGDCAIVYDTTGAHDNRMGVCRCKACEAEAHKNLLGKTLMQVREALRL